MDLQSVYYIMAITFMSLLTIFVIGLIALTIFIAQKVSEIQKTIERRAEEVTAPFRQGTEVINALRDMF